VHEGSCLVLSFGLFFPAFSRGAWLVEFAFSLVELVIPLVELFYVW
jgi:hypothetical protein